MGNAPAIAKFRKASKRQYFAIMGRRSTQPQAAELARRVQFGAICAEVGAIYNNASRLAAAKAQFAAQSDKKTLRAFVWSLAKAIVETTTEPIT